ncbi:glycoside hydrolase family 3 N-terminal domain-containing protein [Frigoribacterium salinisoli]
MPHRPARSTTSGHQSHRPRRALAVTATTALAALLATGLPAISASAAPVDLARFGTVTASASQDDADGSFPAEALVDGDPTTRWASGNGPDSADAEFTASVVVDLQGTATVSSIGLDWEASYAERYTVDVATADPTLPGSWTTAATVDDSDGARDEVALTTPTQARYVRVSMLERAPATWDAPTLHWYGYSAYGLQVFGDPETRAVAFDRATATVAAGQSLTAGLSLSGPSDEATTVRVRSTGGTAEAGTDYVPVDETVTFAPGGTTASVALETISTGALTPRRTIELTVDEPSADTIVGTRATTVVTLTPTGDLPNSGASTVLDDFEDGVPSGYTTWGSAPAVTPVLGAAAPGRDGSGQALEAVVAGPTEDGSWFGFTHDTPATDWSSADGFSFWFEGTGSGGTLRYELKNGQGALFEVAVPDDSVGWRQVSVLFSDLRLKGQPDSDQRFDPTASTGFAVTLTALGAGTWRFDDVALFERATTIEDFEGEVPLGTASDPVGFFTWAGPDAAAVDVTREVTVQERGGVADNHVLSGRYQVPSGSWGGFSHNLAESQDWSSYQGIRFWWYASQPNNPASPTAGSDIKVEIKDGDPAGSSTGETSELWQATFRDNWGSSTSRWKLVELPFSAFTLGGYQPGDEATRNGTLDLTAANGYALTFPVGTPGPVGYAVDDVQLYGTPARVSRVAVEPSQDVHLVDAGGAATIPMTLTTADGEPLGSDVAVEWSTSDDSAVAGTDYVAADGTLTFPAGTASGDSRDVVVETLAATGAAESKQLRVELTSTTARVGDGPRVVIRAHDLPYLDAALPTAERVEDLLARMSLEEKVGQMAQAERLGLPSTDDISRYGLGSILSGGGSVPEGGEAVDWADMVDGYQREALSTPLQIPMIYGVDAVHGHSNVEGATIFPHNTGLGAARDPELVREIMRVTAQEVRATGIPWTFAPCLCVTRDERWGRSYESFGEDPDLVRTFAAPSVLGLQGDDPTDIGGADEVLATAKHWAGDGGTSYDESVAGTGGYPIDQGVTEASSLDEFRRLHVDPYLPAIEAGVGTIMPSYSAVDLGDGPVRMHENGALNTDLLKDELGFEGFLISDWEGIDKLPGGSYAEKSVRSVNAGLDMAMAPYNYDDFITAIVEGVRSGDVAQARVDDAVRRILTQKFDLNLFEQPFAERAGIDEVGSAEHRAVARRAAAQSQVLLQDSGVLPLSDQQSIYLAGSTADDLGRQMGGWTISWQGGSGDTTTGTSIAEGMREVAPEADITVSPDASAPMTDGQVGVVVVGERPYAEGQGDVPNNGSSLSLTAQDRATIDTVCGAMECVVLVVSGRPQLLDGVLDVADAVVASFLPGSEGTGVADVLFGDEPFAGRLPVTWAASADQVPINVGDESYDPAFPYGWGLRTDVPRDRLEALAASLPAGGAQEAVQVALDADVWAADGTVADAPEALRLLLAAAAALTGTDTATMAAADDLVSLARDLAQVAMLDGTAADGSAAITADAEHAVAQGRPDDAVIGFASVLGLVLEQPTPGPGPTPGPTPGPGEEPSTRVVAATLDPATARVGDRVTVSAEGFAPGERLKGTVFSEPRSIGAVRASGSGSGALAFTVPADLEPGAHRVVLEGAGQRAEAVLTVLAAEGAVGAGDGRPVDGALAWTGSDAWIGVLGAALLLVLLGVLLAVRRRRLD